MSQQPDDINSKMGKGTDKEGDEDDCKPTTSDKSGNEDDK